jgi:hypothetical protein
LPIWRLDVDVRLANGSEDESRLLQAIQQAMASAGRL